MQKGIYLFIYLILFLLLFACHSNDKKEKEDHSKQEDAMKNNDMKGMVMDDKQNKVDRSHVGKLNLGSIVEPVNETVLASVKTIKPQQKSLPILVDAPGYITYNPTNASAIASRYSGRIDKLYVKYNFQEVEKEQKIMEIYSPELLTAQQNLIFLLNSDSTATALIQSAKQRIKLLGLTEDQIRNIIKTRKADYLLPVYSPVSGHIHEMNSVSEITMPTMEMEKNKGGMNGDISGEEISIKEGSYLQKGQTVFSVISAGRIWAILKIYPEDISRIKLNQPVEISTESQPDKIYTDKVGFIEPVYEQDSKYLSVRVYLDNCSHHDLKIGLLIKGRINTGSHQGLWIPKTSILDLGNNTKVVFVKSGNVFKTHKIVTGTISDGEVEILEGLSESDEIAMDGQFLIDSEGFVNTNQ